jgi:predicted dehydrogenase
MKNSLRYNKYLMISNKGRNHMKQVGFGLIGAGRIGKIHSLCIAKISNAKLVAVTDLALDRAKEIAKEHKADAYKDYKDLLKRKDIDAVIVAVPTHAHRAVTVDAAEAGKHVYCEKPMALTLREADEMLKAVKKAEVKLMIGEQVRFIFNKVKKLLDEGVVGKINIIRSCLLGWYPSDWMCDPKKGGGMIIDTSVHNADLIRWLTGSEVERVYAESGAFVIDECKEMMTEDNAIYLLKMKNGVIGEVYSSWTGKGAGGFSLEIFGTKGMMFSHPLSQPLAVFSAKKIPNEFISEGWNLTSFLPPIKASGWFDSLKHFVNCIVKDKEPMVNGKEGRADLEVVLAAYKSSKTGKPIELPLKYKNAL